jgi:cyclase
MKSRATRIVLVLAALWATPVFAQPNYGVQKVGDGIWVAQPDQGANVSWFLLGDEVVVIDSGPDVAGAKAILAKIAETAGKPVRYLIVTHAHGDHAGGVPVFAAAGAQIICAENAAGGIASVLEKANTKSRSPFLTLSERMGFIGGPRRAAVYWLGPAHTAGDLVVLLPDDRILFSGDIVLNRRLPYMQAPDMDPKSWEKILLRLAALEVDTVVPGHGEVGQKQAIADSLAYVRRVNEIATRFLETRIPEELYPMKLRDPDNRIENVSVTPEHIANIKAVVRHEKARLEKAPTPTPTPAKRVPKK